MPLDDPAATVFQRGDFIQVRRLGDEEWVRGMVGLASPNGKSLMLLINGGIRGGDGFMIGSLPLLWEDGSFRGLFTPDDEYEVRKKEEPCR